MSKRRTPRRPVTGDGAAAEVEGIISSGLSIISNEIKKMTQQTRDASAALDHQAAKSLNEYLRTLLLMKKDARYESFEADLEDLGDADLKELAKQALRYASDATEDDEDKES